MIRYDYKCTECGHIAERTLPITSRPSRRYNCGKCGGRKCQVRQMGLGNVMHQGINGAAHTYTQYPVVSNRLPFAIPGEQHAGPLKKTVITSRAHEKRVYDRLGMVRGD